MNVVSFFVLMLSAAGCFASDTSSKSAMRDQEAYRQMISAVQHIQVIVDDWKCELEWMQREILELNIHLNCSRKFWSASKLLLECYRLQNLIESRAEYAHKVFDPGGEYDIQASRILNTVRQK